MKGSNCGRPHGTVDDLIPEYPSSSSSPSNPSAPSSPLTPTSTRSCLPPSSLASLLGGTFVEVGGPYLSNPRSGQQAVYSLTTGNISCYRHPTSPFHWYGFRNGDSQVEHFGWNPQPPKNMSQEYVSEITALHQTLAIALHSNYNGRHTNLSVDASLGHFQPLVNKHLYSKTMAAHSTVHILFDFSFLERRLVDGREVQVKVVITVEFYQALWRAGTQLWNRRGSLNVIDVACHMINHFGDLYTFQEVIAMDPMPDRRILQSQVTPATINALRPPIVPTTVAITNPGPLMTQNAQLPVIMHTTPNSTSRGPQMVSNPVSGLDLDQDSILIAAETTPCFNNTGIDLSSLTLSGPSSLSESGLPRSQRHFGPSNPQGLWNVQSGSSVSSFSQQDIQLSFTNEGSWTADRLTMLLQATGTDNHQMVDYPAFGFEVIGNNDESVSMVVPDLQDNGALVVIDANQPAITPARPARSFPCPYLNCPQPPFSTRWNLNAHLNTHNGVTFTCTYDGCGKVYARHGDRLRHIKIVHWGCFWSCDRCLKVHVRKPTASQMYGCIRNDMGPHDFNEYN